MNKLTYSKQSIEFILQKCIHLSKLLQQRMGQSMRNPQEFTRRNEQRKYLQYVEKMQRKAKYAQTQQKLKQTRQKHNSQLYSSPSMMKKQDDSIIKKDNQTLQYRKDQSTGTVDQPKHRQEIKDYDYAQLRNSSKIKNNQNLKEEQLPIIQKQDTPQRKSQKSITIDRSSVQTIPKTKTFIFNKHVYTIDAQKLKAHRLKSKLRYENGLSKLKSQGYKSNIQNYDSRMSGVPLVNNNNNQALSKHNISSLELQSQTGSNVMISQQKLKGISDSRVNDIKSNQQIPMNVSKNIEIRNIQGINQNSSENTLQKEVQKTNTNQHHFQNHNEKDQQYRSYLKSQNQFQPLSTLVQKYGNTSTQLHLHQIQTFSEINENQRQRQHPFELIEPGQVLNVEKERLNTMKFTKIIRRQPK